MKKLTKIKLKEIIKEIVTNISEKSNTDGFSEYNVKNIIRNIPTGASVFADLTNKKLKIRVTTSVAAPPLTTKDIDRIQNDIFRYIKLFINDANKFGIEIIKTNIHPYIFMTGAKNKILFTSNFDISVKTKANINKLEILEKALNQI